MVKREVVVVVLVGLMLISGCTSSERNEPNLIVYGHSYTGGHGVPPWPERTARQLGINFANRGRGGDVVAATTATVRAHPKAGADDIVIIESGLNDARAYGTTGVPAFKGWLDAALWRSRFAGGLVLVLDPTLPGADGDLYRGAARGLADKYGAAVVEPPKQLTFQADGIHPDRQGQRAYAEAVSAAVRGILSKREAMD